MSDYEKRGYLLENFRLFHLRSEQGISTDYHYHEFCKVLLLVSGSGSYYIEGQRYLIQSGDVVLVGSRSVHRPELDAAVRYERIIFYISPEYLERESTPDCNLQSLFSGEHGHVLRLKDAQRSAVFQLAASMEKDLQSNLFGREIVVSAGMLRLLVEIGRSMLAEEDDCLPSPLVPRNERILEIMRYLDENLEEDINLDSLAETFFISKYHMMRLFRRETGMTIFLYLTQKKLLLARELIAGGMRATDACYRCGFRSYSSFTRAYARHFGTTPTGRADRTHAREEGNE